VPDNVWVVVLGFSELFKNFVNVQNISPLLCVLTQRINTVTFGFKEYKLKVSPLGVLPKFCKCPR
jgi:hypothetical protein